MGPATAISNITNANSFRLDRSYTSIVNGAGELLVRQFDSWRFQFPTLVAALVVVIRWPRDIVLLSHFHRRHRRRNHPLCHVDPRV